MRLETTCTGVLPGNCRTDKCQVTPIHFLQPDFITGERVVYQYAVVTGYDDTLEKLHELGGGVVTAFASRTQVQLEIGNEHRGNLLNGYVRYVVLALNELGKVVAGDFVLAVSRYRLRYAHKLLHIVIVLLEQDKDSFVALAMPQELVLNFLGGHVIVTPLHFVVNGIQGRTYVVQKGVYPPGIPAFGFARSNAPVVGLDALFRTELAKFAVYGDACHNHNLAVFLFRTFLQIKKNLECRFHNSLFLVAKLIFTSRFRVMQTMD